MTCAPKGCDQTKVGSWFEHINHNCVCQCGIRISWTQQWKTLQMMWTILTIPQRQMRKFITMSLMTKKMQTQQTTLTR